MCQNCIPAVIWNAQMNNSFWTSFKQICQHLQSTLCCSICAVL